MTQNNSEKKTNKGGLVLKRLPLQSIIIRHKDEECVITFVKGTNKNATISLNGPSSFNFIREEIYNREKI